MEGDRTERSKKADKSQEDKHQQKEKTTEQRSIISKINDLEEVNEQNPEIILITETWSNKDILNSILQLEWYFIELPLRCDTTDTANGIQGGLLVYVKHEMTILKTDNINTVLQFCQFKVLSDNNQGLNVTAVYRFPNSPNINSSELCELFNKFSRQEQPNNRKF